MSDEFTCHNCRRQSVIYSDETRDDARVVCRTCGTSLGTLAQFRRLVERRARDTGEHTSRC